MSTRILATAAALGFGVCAVLSGAAGAQASERTGKRTVRSATYAGGAGSTWKTGRDAHGFAGSYGGCRYTGAASPRGYRLKKAC